MEQVFENLKQEVNKFLAEDSSGHDLSHVERVFNLAMNIQKSEGGNELVIGASALAHDICRPWEKKTGKSHFGEEALGIIKPVLEKVISDKQAIKEILDVIAEHDKYDWIEKDESKSIELQIVQDADNLDAIGAIGIARTFTFGGAHGLTMWKPGENLVFGDDYVELPGKFTTTVTHIYEKLLKLKDYMNTPTGKKLAIHRHEIMENYMKDFFAEWEGKQ